MRRSPSGSPLTRWFVQDSANKISDEELVERAQQGDNGAVEQLLERYKNAVCARARRYFLAGGEAEDLIQEGLIGVHSAIVGYKRSSGKSFKNFAYLCMTRRMVDAVKASARLKNLPLNNYISFFDPDFEGEPVEEATPEAFVLLGEDRSELWLKVSGALSDFEFRVFYLYLDGLSYAQIAEAVGKEMKSVTNAVQRAKKKLQTAFSHK